LRKYLRGWTKNASGSYKKEKQEVMTRIEQLDKKAKTTVLLPHEVELKHCLKARLIQLLREEEIKWYQRSKPDNLLKGDRNTKYFQRLANGKHRKIWIFQLHEGNHVITGDEEPKTYITEYYKTLFGPPNEEDVNEYRRDDIIQVSGEDNEKLTVEFTEKEVKEAIFDMKQNKAPGPNGLPAEFYQTFWEIIKYDMMALFKEFHNCLLPLFHLNYNIITLLPKNKEAINIKQCRPICLLNMSFKFFTKVAIRRLTQVAEKLISHSQTMFIPGRNIMEGSVILHETIHELHRKKMNG
jgi:hypothetical protein